MAFVKFGFKKRSYKKGRKTLSKKNVFGNKSAKSQAKQIYALKKKVNNLSYHIKPETITKDCMIFERVMTTDGNIGSYGVDAWNTAYLIYKNNLFNTSKCNYVMKGDKIRPYNFTIYGEFGNKNYSYPINEEFSNAVSVHCPQTGYLRIILCKLTGQQSNLPSKITRPFVTNVGGHTDFGLINGPLVDNLTGCLKIVKQRILKVNESNPSKMFRIKVKNPGIVSNVASSGTVINYKNEYYVYFQYYAPDILRDGNNQVGPIHYLNVGVKFAFTDTD